jgi:alpha-galactosidase
MVGDPSGMQSICLGASEWLPGSYLNNVMGNQSAPTADTVEQRYGFWSAMGGGINCSWRWFITKEPLDTALGRRWVAEFRALRHLVVGDFYPLLPHTTSETRWVAAQWDRPELGEGVVAAFRRRHAAGASVTLHPQAIDPAATYALTHQTTGREEERSGADLLAGITITLPAAPAHEIVRYRRR